MAVFGLVPGRLSAFNHRHHHRGIKAPKVVMMSHQQKRGSSVDVSIHHNEVPRAEAADWDWRAVKTVRPFTYFLSLGSNV
mmetsp:Transcript_45835/g.146203  ORF Transcript_45835/g.146203 Transcript_45835/m.146203 type:complete len:80 (+) Transcript_45835:111-350(+)